LIVDTSHPLQQMTSEHEMQLGAQIVIVTGVMYYLTDRFNPTLVAWLVGVIAVLHLGPINYL
jgi:hypothetical protein